ncbi:MAG: family 20 glycosylhydrolase [Candidatus Hydrogenedentes bacterium]|nr:family 20 glycosylhydrolase [Candidatus Hydrogenedentota bacterium]
MKFIYYRNVVFLAVAILCLAASCASTSKSAHLSQPAPVSKTTLPSFGVHVFAPMKDGWPVFVKAVDEALAPMGVTTLIVQMDYQYAFQSHPELAEVEGSVVTKEDVAALVAVCRKHNIRLIPQLNCLGHQSWGSSGNHALLRKYPQFDETPEIPRDAEGVYSRSWCPLHPDVNPIVFSLMDELIDAFQCDAFHVGMDEVFLIANPNCPRCAGKDPAELFAKAVNDYYQHLVVEKKLTMYMWGDRLLDRSAMGYNKYECSENGTASAVDRIPKDIVICDWHYSRRDEYPSIPFFQEKGFRVWPSAWRSVTATKALHTFSVGANTGKVPGFLCTTWTSTAELSEALLGQREESSLDPTQAGVLASMREISSLYSKKDR